MCSCGAPQSGDDITGLVSPGLCGAGCAVQGGEEAGCEEGALRVERAATAEERAVCMACCSGAAPDPRAATSRDDGGQTIGFRRTARRRLRRAVHEEPSDGSGMRWSSMRGSSMRCGRDLRSYVTPQGCGGGQRTERGDDDAASQLVD